MRIEVQAVGGNRLVGVGKGCQPGIASFRFDALTGSRPLPEKSVAFPGKAGAAPGAFNGRLDQCQGGWNDVNP